MEIPSPAAGVVKTAQGQKLGTPSISVTWWSFWKAAGVALVVVACPQPRPGACLAAPAAAAPAVAVLAACLITPPARWSVRLRITSVRKFAHLPACLWTRSRAGCPKGRITDDVQAFTRAVVIWRRADQIAALQPRHRRGRRCHRRRTEPDPWPR